MPPSRVPIPPYLLSSTWASANIPTRHLRAVLCLPGELRPVALRSFYSLAYRSQLQQIGSGSTANEHAPNANALAHSQSFPNRGLAGSSLGGKEQGTASRVVGHLLNSGRNEDIGGFVKNHDIRYSGGEDDSGISGESEATLSSESRGTSASQSLNSDEITNLDTALSPEVGRIILDVSKGERSNEELIYKAYNEYRAALCATEVAYIARTFPERLIEGRSSEAFLARIQSSKITFLQLGNESESGAKSLRSHLIAPAIRLIEALEDLGPGSSRTEELKRIIGQFSFKNLSTADEMSLVYADFRADLLASRFGHLFRDFPEDLGIETWAWFQAESRKLREGKWLQSQMKLLDDSGGDGGLNLQPKIAVGEGRLRYLAIEATLNMSEALGELDPDIKRNNDAYRRFQAQLKSQFDDSLPVTFPARLGPRPMEKLLGMLRLWKNLQTNFRRQLERLSSQADDAEKKSECFRKLDQVEKSIDALKGFIRKIGGPEDTETIQKMNDIVGDLKKLKKPGHKPSTSRIETHVSLKPSAPFTISAADSQPFADVSSLRQRIASMRSKLDVIGKGSSYGVVEKEVKQLELALLSSFSCQQTPDDASSLLKLSAPSSFSVPKTGLDNYDQLTGAHGGKFAGAISTVRGPGEGPRISKFVSAKGASIHERKLFLDVKTDKGFLEVGTTMQGVKRQTLKKTMEGERMKHQDPSSNELSAQGETFGGSSTLQIGHQEKADEQLSNSNRPSPTSTSPQIAPTTKAVHLSNSDSVAILELKAQVAELKDSIRYLNSQLLSKSLEPTSLASRSLEPVAPVAPNALSMERPTRESASAMPAAPAFEKSLEQSTSILPAPNLLGEKSLADTGDAHTTVPWDAASSSNEHEFSNSNQTLQSLSNIEKIPQSLLEELFPEEVTGLTRESKGEQDPIPRLPVPRVPLHPTDELRAVSSEVAASKPRWPSTTHRRALISTMTNNTIGVLELRYASNSLTEEDFRKLIPRGKHMKEWAVRGEFRKVFPKRDPWTLERNGSYYIVFPSVEDAYAYQKHVHHVHNLARQHTPTSLTSQIAPPPGYKIEGDDVDALVQSFSLIPPQQKLYMLSLAPPWTPFRENLFRRGGYPQILGEGRESIAQVLIEFPLGRQPSWFEIRDAVSLDGRRRGLEWKLLPGESSVRKVDMERHGKGEDKDRDEDFERGNMEQGRKKDVQERLKTPKYGQKWILSFETLEEARRFALTWHGRAFPWHRRAGVGKGARWESGSGGKFGEQVLMVKAEVLW